MKTITNGTPEWVRNLKWSDPVVFSENTLVKYESPNARLQILNSNTIVLDNVLYLLIKAFNNRTREKNYFQKYCELLSGEITENEFNEEIRANLDKYVLPAGEFVGQEDVFTATKLASHLMGINSSDDFQSVFSINDESLVKSVAE